MDFVISVTCENPPAEGVVPGRAPPVRASSPYLRQISSKMIIPSNCIHLMDCIGQGEVCIWVWGACLLWTTSLSGWRPGHWNWNSYWSWKYCTLDKQIMWIERFNGTSSILMPRALKLKCWIWNYLHLDKQMWIEWFKAISNALLKSVRVYYVRAKNLGNLWMHKTSSYIFLSMFQPRGVWSFSGESGAPVWYIFTWRRLFGVGMLRWSFVHSQIIQPRTSTAYSVCMSVFFFYISLQVNVFHILLQVNLAWCIEHTWVGGRIHHLTLLQ